MNIRVVALYLLLGYSPTGWSQPSLQNEIGFPFPDDEIPLLEKKTNPGFAPLEDQLQLSCQIYADRIVIDKGIGGVFLKTIHTHQLRGDIFPLISQASKGLLTTTHSPVDLPITTYTAYSQSAQENSEIKLYARVYQGEMIYRNETPAARQLVKFLDINCNF